MKYHPAKEQRADTFYNQKEWEPFWWKKSNTAKQSSVFHECKEWKRSILGAEVGRVGARDWDWHGRCMEVHGHRKGCAQECTCFRHTETEMLREHLLERFPKQLDISVCFQNRYLYCHYDFTTLCNIFYVSNLELILHVYIYTYIWLWLIIYIIILLIYYIY